MDALEAYVARSLGARPVLKVTVAEDLPGAAKFR